MDIVVFYGSVDDFDEEFYMNNFLRINQIKKFSSYNSSINQKESILAWCVVLKYTKILPDEVELRSDGKPSIKHCSNYFNISHSHGKVVVAFSNSEIGIDIETISSKDHSRLYKKVLTSEEQIAMQGREDLFYKLWTLKESTLKHSGEGLSGGLNNYDFSDYIEKERFSIDNKFYYSIPFENCYLSICSSDNFDVVFKKITEYTLTD